MNNTKESLKALFIEESWRVHTIHSREYDSFTPSRYEGGATWLLQCLKNSQIDATYMPAHTVQVVFPEDVAQLEQYDAIVISDVGSNTFLLQNDTLYQFRIKPDALELIKECVSNGGGLLMVGDHLPFVGTEAKANYKNTVLADVLPVMMLDGNDRVEKPEGVIAQPSQPEHPVIKGFPGYPFLLGYNRAIVKENAEVVLTTDNDPLLVFGNYHNRKMVCFMSDCSPHWGTQQLMSWSFYITLWVNMLTHTAR